jgi:hypothetical protein
MRAFSTSDSEAREVIEVLAIAAEVDKLAARAAEDQLAAASFASNGFFIDHDAESDLRTRAARQHDW